MSQGFGRKGVVAGAPTQPRPTAFGVQRPAALPVDDDLSPAARAFLAQERANRGPSTEDVAARAAQSAIQYASPATKKGRSMIVAYVLWWFASPIGAHRFYLGANQSAFMMLALFFGSFVALFVAPLLGVAMLCAWGGWHFVDAFKIPGLMRRYRERFDDGDLRQVFA
jgi:TM2 domain-containing membrane protein YozV